jgi:hypothetical protein
MFDARCRTVSAHSRRHFPVSSKTACGPLCAAAQIDNRQSAIARAPQANSSWLALQVSRELCAEGIDAAIAGQLRKLPEQAIVTEAAASPSCGKNIATVGRAFGAIGRVRGHLNRRRKLTMCSTDSASVHAKSESFTVVPRPLCDRTTIAAGRIRAGRGGSRTLCDAGPFVPPMMRERQP